jgi:type VI secretion system protein ImpG
LIDDLIEYYQRELTFLRESAGAFADAHPKIASRLRLTRETVEDPHIGRLIEAVAFMNARLRHKLDDEFPEISDAILMTLYPHLIQPVPSFFVARLEPSAELAKPLRVPKGTALTTEPIEGESCRYVLAQDTLLMPLKISAAAMGGLPLDAPALGLAAAKGVLRISLATPRADISIASLGLDSLRFYIKGDARRAQLLIEQLGVNLLGIGVGTALDDSRAVLLPAGALRIMGLEDYEMLLPQGKVSNLAYAALQEYFAFPQKHLFFEINGLTARTLDLAGQGVDLFLYFDRVSSELERVVRGDDFELFACPAINLFETEAEPIQLDHSAIEYRIVPDARREDSIEVHSVLGVSLQDGSGERVVAPPLYSMEHSNVRKGRFFHAVTRRSSFGPGGGDDVYLSVADLDGALLKDDATVAATRVLVTNRDLPSRLPFGGGRPHLEVAEGIAGLGPVSALTKPTPTRRPARRRAALWKLIGQLSLNHMSLVGGGEGAKVLRELLALYDMSDSAETAFLRDRLVDVSAQPGVARVRLRGHTAVCAGVDVTIEIDDERFSGSGAYLMCAVLERFLGSSCQINSFVRLSAKLQRDPGIWKHWVPRIGDRVLV